MAITLSGDGIARANLAADVIDSTKLADDAVNSEHYVDASIDNAHLADDAVGVAELSATGTASSSTFLRGDNAWAAAGGGKVLQHRIYTFGTSNISTSSSTYSQVGSNISFTPTSSSSQLLFNLQHYANVDRSNVNNAYLRVALTKDSTSPTTESAVVAGWITGPSYASGVDQDYQVYSRTGFMDNDSTSEITFRVYFLSNDNARTLYFHHITLDFGNPSFLEITEIDSSITDST